MNFTKFRSVGGGGGGGKGKAAWPAEGMTFDAETEEKLDRCLAA